MIRYWSNSDRTDPSRK